MATGTIDCCLNVEAHFNTVALACQSISPKWEELAKHLNIDRSTVLSIQAEMGQKMGKCLDELLDVWLRQPSRNHPKPSWRILCDAVCNIDRPLSEKIWTDHTSGCSLCRASVVGPVVPSVSIPTSVSVLLNSNQHHESKHESVDMELSSGSEASPVAYKSVDELYTEAVNLRDKFLKLLEKLNEFLDSVDNDRLKLKLNWHLTCERENTRKVKKILLEKIGKLTSPNEVLNCLIHSNLIGYLNYRLLDVFQGLINDKEVDEMITKYEEAHEIFLKSSDLETLAQLFLDHPTLAPETFAGLPRFTVHLDKEWEKKSAYQWSQLLKTRFNHWPPHIHIVMITKKCIIIEYSVLPCNATDIVRDLSDSQVLSTHGVTEIELSEQLREMGRNDQVSSTVMYHSIRYTCNFPSNKCFAFEGLKVQIGKQYKNYQTLHRKGEIGRLPGMYEDGGNRIPSDTVSGFLRGGIINIVACFEGFLMNLYMEVKDFKKHGRIQCDPNCKKCEKNEYDHVVPGEHRHEIPDRLAFLRFHKFLEIFQDNLGLHSFSTKLFDWRNEYYHLIDDRNISKLEIDRNIMCALFSLLYGIRCALAHGNPDRTLVRGVMQNFPICQECSNDHHPNLKKISDISNAFDTLIKEKYHDDPTEVLKTSRKYPDPKPFESSPKDSNTVEQDIHDIFPNVKKDKERTTKEPLDGKYALFHLCRIGHWLEEGKRENMYITFNMLMRINQIVLVLSHRIYITVARMLRGANCESLSATWGVPDDDDEVKQMIAEFTQKHKKMVEDLQKEDFSYGYTCCGNF